MAAARSIERVPWDSAALGCDAWELASAVPEVLAQARAPGHYTVRVDPRADKRALHVNGFYYCDTLVEPFCAAREFKPQPHPVAVISRDTALEPLLAICRGAFRHGRFHRDFNVERARADLRYENWLRALHAAGKVYGLLWEQELAGFIAHALERITEYRHIASLQVANHSREDDRHGYESEAHVSMDPKFRFGLQAKARLYMSVARSQFTTCDSIAARTSAWRRGSLSGWFEAAYGQDVKVLALDIAERETIIRALEDRRPASRSSGSAARRIRRPSPRRAHLRALEPVSGGVFVDCVRFVRNTPLGCGRLCSRVRHRSRPAGRPARCRETCGLSGRRAVPVVERR